MVATKIHKYKEEKEPNLAEGFDEFTEASSMVGARYLHSKFKLWFRVGWGLIMLTFLGLTGYQMTQRFLWYFENPIQIDLEEHDGGPLKLPKVTICNTMQAKLFNPRRLTLSGVGEKESGVPYDFMAILPLLLSNDNKTRTEAMALLKDVPNYAAELRAIAAEIGESTVKLGEFKGLQERADRIKAKIGGVLPETVSHMITLEGPCEEGWYFDSATLRCLWSPKIKVDFDTAEQLCEDKGGYLASTHSGLETESLTKFANQCFRKDWDGMGSIVADSAGHLDREPLKHSPNVWIGLTDKDSHGTFHWTDGSDHTRYTSWADSRDEEHKLGLHCVQFEDGLWLPQYCGKLNYPLCSKKITSKELCGEGNWYFDSVTSLCYQMHANISCWCDADDHCQRMGGHLPSLHSDRDVLKIFKFATEETSGRWLNDVESLHIGLTDKEEEDVWEWTDGTAKDYFRWDRYYKDGILFQQPTDHLKSQDCGAITTKGSFIDHECYGTYGVRDHTWYICTKKTINSVYKSSQDYLNYRLGTMHQNLRCSLLEAAENLDKLYRLNITTWLYEAAQPMEDLFMSCSYLNKPCKITKKVGNEGVCFQVEAEKPEDNHVDVPGPELAMVAALDMETYEQVPGLPAGSVKIHLENPEESVAKSFAGFVGYPGQAMQVQITEQHEVRRHPSHCGSLDLQYVGNYSKLMCQWEQFLEYEKEKCHCAPVLNPKLLDRDLRRKEEYEAQRIFTADHCVEEVKGIKCAHYGNPVCLGEHSYQGSRNQTITGLDCMNWSEDRFHAGEDHNKCRNPDMGRAPWCYVSQKQSAILGEWEFCFPDCDKLVDGEPQKCLEPVETGGYCAHHGHYFCRTENNNVVNPDHKNTDKNGIPCMEWSDLDTSNFLHFHEESNYCGNPDKSHSAWCFIRKNNATEKSFCFPDCSHFAKSQSCTELHDYSSKGLENQLECNTMEQIICYHDIIDTTTHGDANLDTTKCPENCYEITYKVDLTGGPITRDNLLPYIPKNWTDIQNKKLQEFKEFSAHVPVQVYTHREQLNIFHLEFLAFYNLWMEELFLKNAGIVPCMGYENKHGNKLHETMYLEETNRYMEDLVIHIREIWKKETQNLSSMSAQDFDKVAAAQADLMDINEEISQKLESSMEHKYVVAIVKMELDDFLKCSEEKQNNPQQNCMDMQEYYQYAMDHFDDILAHWKLAKLAHDILFDWWYATYHIAFNFDRNHLGTFHSEETQSEISVAKTYAPGTAASEDITKLWTYFKDVKNALLEYSIKFPRAKTNGDAASPAGVYAIMTHELDAILDSNSPVLLRLVFPKLVDTEEIEAKAVDQFFKPTVHEWEKCLETNIGHIKRMNLDIVFLRQDWLPRFQQMIADLGAYAPGDAYNSKNVMLLKIFYRDLRATTVLEKDSYNAWTLLAEMGGTSGLYVGATLVTIFECVLFILELKGFIAPLQVQSIPTLSGKHTKSSLSRRRSAMRAVAHPMESKLEEQETIIAAIRAQNVQLERQLKNMDRQTKSIQRILTTPTPIAPTDLTFSRPNQIYE